MEGPSKLPEMTHDTKRNTLAVDPFQPVLEILKQLEEVNEKLQAGNIQLCKEGNHLKLRQDEQVARLHTIDNALDEVRGNFIGVLKVWNDRPAGDSAILPRDGFPKR
ncbi:hypothetical protein N7517_008195 [Penicillium concentricum]|uniref:Uncharacterized protein n=1 Tax=Penicillium concentricum TaxID=293559 RepID=A0A9W9RU42_9EURO|nr:uncharacterized protein N7517_008195 [Penicillium concentricum]KAJ5365309.1 hypothetical protein N7517_008195 [Penicillium concentricum]